MSLDLRQGGALALERAGYLDGPRVRALLIGEEVETWRRTCKCRSDCRCWTMAGRRPATEEDRRAFAEAQAVAPPKAPARETPLHESLVRIAPRGQQELGLGGAT